MSPTCVKMLSSGTKKQSTEPNICPAWIEHSSSMNWGIHTKAVPKKGQTQSNLSPTWVQHEANVSPTHVKMFISFADNDRQTEPSTSPTWIQHESNTNLRVQPGSNLRVQHESNMTPFCLEAKLNYKSRGVHRESNIFNASGKCCENMAHKIVTDRKKL